MTIGVRLLAAGTAIGAVATVLATACGSGVGGNWSIGDAKQFSDYSLYWVGDDFEGFPLTEIFYDRGDLAKSDEDVLFSYGSCTRNPFSGECEYPLWILVKPHRAGPPANSPGSRRVEKHDVTVTVGGWDAALVGLAAKNLEVVNNAP